MLAVWRLHHLTKGDDVVVLVAPGEWPDGVPHEVKGVRVEESDKIGGPLAVMVLGRVGSVWRWALQLAYEPGADFSLDDLSLVTSFGEVSDEGDIRFWLSPSPETGEVPMWTVVRST
jgi:hypothetical protein